MSTLRITLTIVLACLLFVMFRPAAQKLGHFVAEWLHILIEGCFGHRRK